MNISYNKQVQKYIVKNIETIIKGKNVGVKRIELMHKSGYNNYKVASSRQSIYRGEKR